MNTNLGKYACVVALLSIGPVLVDSGMEGGDLGLRWCIMTDSEILMFAVIGTSKLLVSRSQTYRRSKIYSSSNIKLRNSGCLNRHNLKVCIATRWYCTTGPRTMMAPHMLS